MPKHEEEEWKRNSPSRKEALPGENDHWNLQSDHLHHCSAPGDVESCPQPQAGKFLSTDKQNCSFPPGLFRQNLLLSSLQLSQTLQGTKTLGTSSKSLEVFVPLPVHLLSEGFCQHLPRSCHSGKNLKKASRGTSPGFVSQMGCFKQKLKPRMEKLQNKPINYLVNNS